MATKRNQRFYSLLEILFPTVEPFLRAQTDFQFLSAIILSAQMTDTGVNKATEKLFQKMYTPKDALMLGEDGIYNFVKSVNYAPTKAKNIFRTAKIICEQFDGKVPRKRAELISLPGVGNKTAGVFLVQKQIEPAFPVDTHIARVAKAFGFTQETNSDKIEADLRKCFPREWWYPLHLRMILYGRKYLPARKIPSSSKEALALLEGYAEKITN
jgi:endonuclease III